MKTFHISDVLSVATGRLVSLDGMDGIYRILKHLTGDHVYSHQISRGMRECEPWMRAQFPQLMPDNPKTAEQLRILTKTLAQVSRAEDGQAAVLGFVVRVREAHGLPEQIPVYELPEGWHLGVDPVEELRAMRGDDNVIALQL